LEKQARKEIQVKKAFELHKKIRFFLLNFTYKKSPPTCGGT